MENVSDAVGYNIFQNNSLKLYPYSFVKETRLKLKKEIQIYFTNWILTVFVPSVYTVVFIVSLPLNVMAIIMFLVKIKVKKPAVVYMLNLAAADVLFVLFLPLNIIYRFSGNNWLIGDGMCRFFIAAFYCNMYCSILLITSMSVDRFLAVVFPIQSLSWRTRRRAWFGCIVIWTISIASTVPLLTIEQTKYIVDLNITVCYDVMELSDYSFNVYYFITLILTFFFLPLIITTVCYTGIIRNLSSSKHENTCKKNRAIFLSVIVLCMFVLCFGPTNVLFLIDCVYNNEALYFSYVLCACVSSISCCIDPLIYYYASSQCQRYVYDLLCCKKDSQIQQLKQQRNNAHEKESTERSLLKQQRNTAHPKESTEKSLLKYV